MTIRKSILLQETLEVNFKENINLARIKFIALFICALCKVQTVCFEKIACAFEHNACKDSSLRRIQRFFAGFELNHNLIAKFIFSILPMNAPYRLTLDRTNWKFGSTDINILLLGIVYKGTAFPILFSLLNKRGNSSTNERIELINRFINLCGKNSIESLLADREFVGNKWMEFLNNNNIRYYIRIRENFWIDIPDKNRKVKAAWLFNHLKLNQSFSYPKIVCIQGQYCYLAASKVKDKNGKTQLQIIACFNKKEEAIETYKQRWQIETTFKALKSSGFNIEDTHLTDINRISKLLSVILIAFVWVYQIGIALNDLKPIKIKKHGRKEKSLVKYGLTYINTLLFSNKTRDFKWCLNFLSCT